MKSKLVIAILAVFMSSCSSFMYSNKTVNNTIRINSNVSNYTVSFPLMNNLIHQGVTTWLAILEKATP